ncbi:hypothetical protein O6H91_12G015000 [Diphasiastrum complanatum]|nr:hypothetical protein O6H91_12G015000 [Diphasiastrum complanatum]KAJ7535021.1 hypothetical protein O6H91_12G015000 [Diphasiastrum complanatum]KAJ7535023.1 hypothetical protein O6H91_12G015000 [Diphasiastrum complanatum]
MRQLLVSNSILNHCALRKGLQRYAQADLFALSRSFAPSMPPLLGREMSDGENWDNVQGRGETFSNLLINADAQNVSGIEEVDVDSVIKEDAKLHDDYGFISKKMLAKVVEGLIGVHLLKGDQEAAIRLMKWLGIPVDYSDLDIEQARAGCLVPRPVLDSIDFDELEAAIGYEFQNKNLLAEAITHASCTLDVPCYQRLEFVGDALLDHLITHHLCYSYKDLPPGGLTDLRAAAVNNNNFARISVKHKLHLHLRHGSSALETRIHDFANDIQAEMHKPVANAFKISNCNPPKVLGDVLESLAGAVFLDANLNVDHVWKVFEPLLQPLVTPETLSIHPVRELQELCQKEAEGLEYRASRVGDMVAVNVFVNGNRIGSAQHLQEKVAKKLAAWSALSVLKEMHLIKAAATQSLVDSDDERKTMSEVRSNFSRRQILNEICSRRRWPKPQYRCVSEGGPPHAKEFTYSVRVYTTEHGWTNDCIGQQMPSVRKAQESAAASLLELVWQLHMHIMV